ITMDPKNLAHLIQVIDEGKISKTAGKEVFVEMFDTNKNPDVIIEEKGLAQISSSDELEKLVDEVLKNNPQSIEDFKAGKKQAAGYLMGQVMKASKGQANPQIAKKMIDDKLAILV
ncbi:MAG: Asp-tRNA(Asn)/Glu-tRNA(Gln) amidotransferase GatCAB subunit B, partial [Intestinibacter bartlettii]